MCSGLSGCQQTMQCLGRHAAAVAPSGNYAVAHFLSSVTSWGLHHTLPRCLSRPLVWALTPSNISYHRSLCFSLLRTYHPLTALLGIIRRIFPSVFPTGSQFRVERVFVLRSMPRAVLVNISWGCVLSPPSLIRLEHSFYLKVKLTCYGHVWLA